MDLIEPSKMIRHKKVLSLLVIPLRAGIVKDLSQYYWSSYNFYVKGRPDDIITEDPLYKEMGKTPEERQRRYRDYVLEARPYERIVDKAMLG